MRDVEQTAAGACMQMFIDNAAIIERHFPAGEIDHFRTGRKMKIVKWRSQQHCVAKLATRGEECNEVI